MSQRFAVLCARVRVPLVLGGLAVILADALLRPPFPLALAGVVAVVLGMVLYLRVGTVRRDPVVVRPPVAGRWLAVNSPADRVPSHGLHAYGQTYAIDLVHEPSDGARPAFGAGPGFRPPTDYPAFGQPVLAPAGGVVVRAHGRERDHRSRGSWGAMLYLVAEGFVRELTGPGRILGNHVVIDHGGGVYSALAHLRRGSIRVRPGQPVSAGEQVAECGNSGNSTEPHLHFQLMDHPSVLVAAGLPFAFDRFEQAGQPRDGVPGGAEPFVAEPAGEVSPGPAGGTRPDRP